MELYLIRHTKPHIEEGICYGQTDLPLSSGFQRDFDRIKSLLPKTIDATFSSPLLRCKALAYELSEDVIFDDRLKEINFGDWELVGWNDIVKDDLNEWMEDFVNISPPNGESFTSLYNRFGDFWSDLTQERYKRVVIVCHAGIIRSALCHVKKEPLKTAFQYEVGYGQVIRINKVDHNYDVEYLDG